MARHLPEQGRGTLVALEIPIGAEFLSVEAKALSARTPDFPRAGTRLLRQRLCNDAGCVDHEERATRRNLRSNRRRDTLNCSRRKRVRELARFGCSSRSK